MRPPGIWKPRKAAFEPAIGWLLAQKPYIVPIPGTRKPERMRENLGGLEVTFTPEELAAIRARLDATPILGARYPEAYNRLTEK